MKSNDGFEMYPLPDTLEGYACIDGDTLCVSTVQSLYPGKGNFRAFLDKIEKEFKRVIIPTPSNRMRMICEKRGYISKEEYFPKPYDCMGEIMEYKQTEVEK